MELNITTSILNLVIFWILGEAADGFFHNEMKRSVIVRSVVFMLIYIVDISMLLFLNSFFHWYSSYIQLIFEQTLFYSIFSTTAFFFYYFSGKKEKVLIKKEKPPT
ncbi:hypothetical protein [Persephonella sp.]